MLSWFAANLRRRAAPFAAMEDEVALRQQLLDAPRFSAGLMRLINTAIAVTVAMTWSDAITFSTGARRGAVRPGRCWLPRAG